jgi:hypothetical protein
MNQWDDLADEVINYVNKHESLCHRTQFVFMINQRILILFWEKHKWKYSWHNPEVLPHNFAIDLQNMGYYIETDF